MIEYQEIVGIDGTALVDRRDLRLCYGEYVGRTHTSDDRRR